MSQDISICMDKRRVRFHSLKGVKHRIKHFIVYLHFQLRLFEDFLSLSCYKAYRVAQIMRHLPHRDHGIPVMFQMSHLHFARNVIRCVHPDDSVYGKGFFRVDGKDLCPRIFGAYRASVDHTVQINVIRVFPGAQHFFLGIDPLDRLPHIDCAALIMNREILPEDLGA